MDKIKEMMHGGHKKEGDAVQQHTTTTTTGAGYSEPVHGQPGYGQPVTTHTEATGEKKHGLFGHGGHKEGEEGEKKHGFLGMGGKSSSSSSSSSDEEREGARERNRIRREKRAARKARTTGGATAVPLQDGTGEKKHGFFG